MRLLLFLLAGILAGRAAAAAPPSFSVRLETNQVFVRHDGGSVIVERSEDFRSWSEAALLPNLENPSGEAVFPVVRRAQFYRARGMASSLESKAGQSLDVSLALGGGQAEWALEGALPEGLTFASGRFSGTPTASAAELGRTGRHTNLLVLVSRLTNEISGEVSLHRSKTEVLHHVRLSFFRNIHAARPDGPSFGTICIKCHGSGFPPDFSPSAGTLIGVNAGGGGECPSALKYIVPGDLGASLIYQKVLGQACGERMPQGGPYYNQEQIDRLARWIAELRPGETD